MTANSEFSVQVVDDEIVVTLPGSHYLSLLQIGKISSAARKVHFGQRRSAR